MLHRIWPFLAVVMFAGVLLAGPAYSQNVSQENTIATQDVISDQLEAFKQAEHQRAFSHAAKNIRQMFGSTDRFIGMVKNGYPAIYNSKSYTFGRNRFESDTIFQEVLVIDQQGRTWQAVYTLQNQDGKWKITGVQVNPTAGTST